MAFPEGNRPRGPREPFQPNKRFGERVPRRVPTNSPLVVERDRPYGSRLRNDLMKEDYVKLVLGDRRAHNPTYLIALRTTADYYGWTEELEAWRPKLHQVVGETRIVHDPGRRGSLKYAGGRRHLVCRSPSTAGMPAGFTNAFRVSARCGLPELAELAHFTSGDWYWMTGPFGERIRRERWESIYQAAA